MNEKTSFLRDPRPDLDVEEKNALLSRKLTGAVWSKRAIVRIDRREIGQAGWEITWRPVPRSG